MNIPLVGQGAGHKGEDSLAYVHDFPGLVNSIRIGIENGMTLIDTAEVYAEGRSEEVIGSAMRGIRDTVRVASKFSPNNHRYLDVLKSAYQSLTRLESEYIDLYQIHWPNPKVALSETLDAMWELKSRGLILEVGVCNFNLKQLTEAYNYARNCGQRIYSVQIKFNINDRFAYNQIYAFCELNDIKIIAYSPVRNAIPSDTVKLLALESIAKSLGATPIQIALTWVISHYGVSAIPESSKPHHLIELAGSTNFELSKSQKTSLDEIFESEVHELAVKEIFSRNTARRDAALNLQRWQIEKFSEDFCPSISELAEEISLGHFLQPILVRKIKSEKGTSYEIMEGELRYWSYVMHYGSESHIPAVIIN